MLITRNRDKLINAMIYFAQNVEYCGKVKLFKLLYFLDFEHYKITGRSVTDMDYYAWKMGPVPVELDEEIEEPEPDMAEAVNFKLIPVRRKPHNMLNIEPKLEFDAKHFTRRELNIMEQLCAEFGDTRAGDMVEATHLENLPWDKVYNQQGQHRALIPYELAFRAQEADQMQRIADEHRELVESLK